MKIVMNAYPHTWPYLLNAMGGPFKDLRVRQAANYAVNRSEMVEMLNGIAVASYGIYVPSQHYYGQPFEYSNDPAKATALLKEASCYPCNIRIAISTSGSGQMQPLPMNELVKEQLEKVGFKVKFDTLDWNSVLTIYLQGAVKTPQYDGLNFSSGATDPLNVLKTVMTSYRAPNGANWGGFSNPELRRCETHEAPHRGSRIGRQERGAPVHRQRSQSARALAEGFRLRAGAKLVPGHHARRRGEMIWRVRRSSSIRRALVSEAHGLAPHPCFCRHFGPGPRM
jgi:hypothetical protein